MYVLEYLCCYTTSADTVHAWYKVQNRTDGQCKSRTWIWNLEPQCEPLWHLTTKSKAAVCWKSQWLLSWSRNSVSHATPTFTDKFTKTCHLNVIKVYNKDGVNSLHHIQHQITEQLMKHGVEMMQNEMVVFCFLMFYPHICQEKNMKNNEKASLRMSTLWSNKTQDLPNITDQCIWLDGSRMCVLDWNTTSPRSNFQ